MDTCPASGAAPGVQVASQSLPKEQVGISFGAPVALAQTHCEREGAR
jgi:hypothetical protein